jgi:hypothetical protein
MKFTFKITIAVLISIVVFYTACKKSENKSTAATTSTTDYKALSSQIASGLYKSLTGSYGGININDGISQPKTGAANRKLQVTNRANSLNPVSLCGFVVDTAFNSKVTAHDTTKTVKGSFHFVYNCDANVLDGYTVNETYTAADSGAHFTDYNSVAQNYVVKALDNTYKLVSMDGTNSVNIQNTFYVTPDPRIARGDQGVHTLSNAYVLTGLKVDFSSGIADITTGVSTFTSEAFDINANTAIDGTNVFLSGKIEFLGNHKAKLSFNGFTPPLAFMVDLLTGTVTPD